MSQTAQLIEPSKETMAYIDGPHKMLIGGDWVQGQGRMINVENPSRGEALTTIQAASLSQVDDAVVAARDAFENSWGTMPGRERAAVLYKMADLLEQYSDVMGEVQCLDNGAPLEISKAIVRYLGADLFRYYAGWCTKITGDAFTTSVGLKKMDFMVNTLREPVGVVGAIVPWNAPAGMIALKVAPALAAGCTMVMKSAELAPLIAPFFAKLLLEAGAPPGTFNLVHGYGDDVGAAISAHPGIDKISFTGSTEVGRKIVNAATGNLKKVTLELGGKSPMIVFPDADLDKAVPVMAMACYVATGQACMAGTRVFAHADIYDELVERLTEYAKTLTVGDGMLPGTMLGPLISARQKERVLNYMKIAQEEGAVLAYGGEAIDSPGHFVRPSLFTNVTSTMRIAQEEVFGPVMSAIKFTDEATMLREVNSTMYGLSGSVWTKDIQRAFRVARAVDSGQVAINHHAAVSPDTPFGGNKQSGWGREFGEEGLYTYLKTKAISIRL